MDTLLKSCENILILLCLSLKYPPCYKDMSFWISESFTENNLCEVVRGIAGDLVEEVHLWIIWQNFFSTLKHLFAFVINGFLCVQWQQSAYEISWSSVVEQCWQYFWTLHFWLCNKSSNYHTHLINLLKSFNQKIKTSLATLFYWPKFNLKRKNRVLL